MGTPMKTTPAIVTFWDFIKKEIRTAERPHKQIVRRLEQIAWRAFVLGRNFERNKSPIKISLSDRTSEKSLRRLQVTLPWTIKYSRDFRLNPQSHKDFTHALIHAQKALGMLAAMVDEIDHDRDAPLLRNMLRSIKNMWQTW